MKARVPVVLEYVVLRGIEGILSDKFLGEIVENEWKHADAADDAFANNFEARHMAEQVFMQWRGLALK